MGTGQLLLMFKIYSFQKRFSENNFGHTVLCYNNEQLSKNTRRLFSVSQETIRSYRYGLYFLYDVFFFFHQAYMTACVSRTVISGKLYANNLIFFPYR